MLAEFCTITFLFIFQQGYEQTQDYLMQHVAAKTISEQADGRPREHLALGSITPLMRRYSMTLGLTPEVNKIWAGRRRSSFRPRPSVYCTPMAEPVPTIALTTPAGTTEMVQNRDTDHPRRSSVTLHLGSHQSSTRPHSMKIPRPSVQRSVVVEPTHRHADEVKIINQPPPSPVNQREFGAPCVASNIFLGSSSVDIRRGSSVGSSLDMLPTIVVQAATPNVVASEAVLHSNTGAATSYVARSEPEIVSANVGPVAAYAGNVPANIGMATVNVGMTSTYAGKVTSNMGTVEPKIATVPPYIGMGPQSAYMPTQTAGIATVPPCIDMGPQSACMPTQTAGMATVSPYIGMGPQSACMTPTADIATVPPYIGVAPQRAYMPTQTAVMTTAPSCIVGSILSVAARPSVIATPDVVAAVGSAQAMYNAPPTHRPPPGAISQSAIRRQSIASISSTGASPQAINIASGKKLMIKFQVEQPAVAPMMRHVYVRNMSQPVY